MRCWLWLSFAALAAALAPTASFGRSPTNHESGDLEQSGPTGGSKFLPPIETVARPSEQRIANDFFVQVIGAGDNAGAILKACDDILPKLTAPSPFRGFVQFTRANALSALNRDLDAIDPIRESIRLLPGYSAPLITASSIYAYLDRPGEAADYLLRAMDVDPESVRGVDDYEIGNLTKRLSAKGDRRRVRTLDDRLLQIGWIGKRLGSSSALALGAIRHRMTEGDVAGAMALIPKLTVPGHSYSLLLQNEYRPLWADVENWSGTQLEQEWAAYVAEARARWSASKEPEATVDYLQALSAAGHYRTAVREILPQFAKPDQLQDYDLLFGVNTMAEALARLGRWKDADSLFDNAQRVWPLGGQANALNIAANKAVFLLKEGRPAEALKLMDEVLADAKRWGGQVGSSAIASMHQYRACMLHELGRDSEARVSMALASAALEPVQIASMDLCLGDLPSAKKALLDGLTIEDDRPEIIAFVQPPPEEPLPSDYNRRLYALTDQLRHDPELLSAVAQYGRILPWAANAGAPSEQP